MSARGKAVRRGMPPDPNLEKRVALLKRDGPERIILFGSRARGEADPWSDHDIIVIKRTDQPFMERLREIVPYLVEFERPAEILTPPRSSSACRKPASGGWCGMKG
ncbi:nucleotidyltransferase domain-containing protein [Thermoflexus hugenholtzii]|uniref:Predicted nucleotidyltransferases n=1 Tax=Thermoflexus hugenholtzii JAD2 TaxID=877466 RepID=A0A212RH89_9CHLR|nr:nucleotidyltransferase domain-containing protein [Thermoflexus hugenholtzii]SNB71571.1 Predicted nucleotidyltransferases [Thermoflexus hugenholtzii JAD2]